jgi:hypothetical protein
LSIFPFIDPTLRLPTYLPTYLSIYGSTVLLLNLGRFFSFLILYTVGWTPWTGDQRVARPQLTHRTTQTQNKRTQISMPRVGFETTITGFQGAKTVHALDHAATGIGNFVLSRALPSLKRLVAKFPPRRPGFTSRQSMWGLWWIKRHWGRFSLNTSVSLANHHSTNFSIIIITRGWHNRPIGGRSAEWTQLDSTPPLYQVKKIIFFLFGLMRI